MYNANQGDSLQCRTCTDIIRAGDYPIDLSRTNGSRKLEVDAFRLRMVSMRRGFELISGVGVRNTWVHACWVVEGVKRIRSQCVPGCPVKMRGGKQGVTEYASMEGGCEVIAYEVE